MRIFGIQWDGKNYPTFEPPFFMDAQLKWRYTLNNRVSPQHSDRDEAVSALQAELQHQGVQS